MNYLKMKPDVDACVDLDLFQSVCMALGGKADTFPLLPQASLKDCYSIGDVLIMFDEPENLSVEQLRALMLGAAACNYVCPKAMIKALDFVAEKWDVFLEVPLCMLSPDSEAVTVIRTSLLYNDRDTFYERVFCLQGIELCKENEIAFGCVLRFLAQEFSENYYVLDDQFRKCFNFLGKVGNYYKDSAPELFKNFGKVITFE